MRLIAVKFGGTSVADLERIAQAADKISREVENGYHVAVVVSAMAGVTNQLVDYCKQINAVPDHPAYGAEYDVVLSSGEQVTSGLMAMMLQQKGIEARSILGWQVPIVTTADFGRARVEHIATEKIGQHLEKAQAVVIPGFQGVTEDGRVTTLGRGGSDTTAMAIAAALGAERCDIYTDVDGVYTSDPRIVKSARKIDTMSYEEMLELASLGAKVLQTRSVEIGMKYDVPIQVLSSFDAAIGSDFPGTLITSEAKSNLQHVENKDKKMERPHITGLAHDRQTAKVTLLQVDNVPGVAARLFKPLSDANITIDMIVQNIAADGAHTDVTFTVPKGDLERALLAIKETENLTYKDIEVNDGMAKISVVGVGLNSNPKIAAALFSTLAESKINIEVITKSEIKISVLIDEKDTGKALNALHDAFNLDAS